MTARPSAYALAALGGLAALFGLTFLDAARIQRDRRRDLADLERLVGRVGVTDLALFNEALHTRHPTQADPQAAFQDHPLAFDPFPTGSLLPPRPHANLD